MSLIRLVSLLVAVALGINLGIMLMALISAGSSRPERPPTDGGSPDWQETIR